jgi:peptide/nickel transport system ATP-binding protein
MIQAQILELLQELSQRRGLAVILVTHDLGVVAEICDHVLVMYAGVTAEYGDVDTIYNHPVHPYTQDLIKAFPNLSNPLDSLISIPGYPPRLDSLPPGCRFEPRCPKAFVRCKIEQPAVYDLNGRHQASCFLVGDQK